MKNLITDLIKFQSQVPIIPKTCSNPFFSQGRKKAMYADLATVIDVCKPVLNKNNLAVIQSLKAIDGKNQLVTILCHSSGETLESNIYLPEIADSQKLTAAVTYLRRASYLAIVGLVGDDDSDGNDVPGTEPQKSSPPKPANNYKTEPPSEAQLKAIAAICNKKGIPRPDIKTNGEAFVWINEQNKGR